LPVILEPPKYSLPDVYRSLSVTAEESDFIQSELYKNSNFLHPRNNRILYQTLKTLRSMQMTLLNTASAYIPSYTRTELTDTLHKTFGFRTDCEFITKSSMLTIIKKTKQLKSKAS
jgi:hypothetical protein